MEKLPPGSDRALQQAEFQARSQLKAAVLEKLSEIEDPSELSSLLADFAEIITRGLADHLTSNGWEGSSMSVQALFSRGPLRDLSYVLWSRWDNFVNDSWRHDIGYTNDCPHLLQYTRRVLRLRFEAKALERVDRVLAKLRDELGDAGQRQKTTDPASASAKNSKPVNRKAVEAFLSSCNSKLSFEVKRKHIWRAAGHKSPRQFQYWQVSDPKATSQDNRSFRRILDMSPSEFEALLKKQRLI